MAGERAGDPLAGDPPAGDPLADVEARLAKAEALPAGARRDALLEEALAALPAAPAGAREEAYRAEVLSGLRRPREAAAAYARVVLSVTDNAEAAHRGLVELITDLGGAEPALEVVAKLKARWPGRAWQWDALEADARKRLRLEAEAPLTPPQLAALRGSVAEALAAAPCRHDDDARPRTAAAALAQGLDAKRVLAWLSELGACCCDCAVATVRGPLEARPR